MPNRIDITIDNADDIADDNTSNIADDSTSHGSGGTTSGIVWSHIDRGTAFSILISNFRKLQFFVVLCGDGRYSFGGGDVMPDDFLCVFCGGPIEGKKRRSTRYCGLECRNSVLAARRKQETLKNRNDREKIVKIHADWLTKFHQELLSWAIPEAGGYQLGLWIGEMTYWFPSIPDSSKIRNTLLRTRSRHSFFSLEPFEPPAVPLIAQYQIRFVQKIPPHPVLPIHEELPRKWIPFAVPIRPLPFRLRGVPRDLR